VDKNVMQLFYDADSDVLYLSIGDPRPAVSEEIDDDVLLRLDPETGEIVGLTVLSLARFTSLTASRLLPLEIDLRKLA
jgi:uncharacterized protein YuzE